MGVVEEPCTSRDGALLPADLAGVACGCAAICASAPACPPSLVPHLSSAHPRRPMMLSHAAAAVPGLPGLRLSGSYLSQDTDGRVLR